MVIASELRVGMAIRIEGEIYKVLEAESKAGAAKLGGVVKTKLRNVTTGRVWEPHFRPQERLEDLELEQRTMEFLFSDGDTCTFMNLENFEQFEVPRAIVGAPEKFLQSGMQVPVEFFEARPISVVFPDLGGRGWPSPHRLRTRNRTAHGKRQHSITASQFECHWSSAQAKLCVWMSRQAAMWNECGRNANGARKTCPSCLPQGEAMAAAR
jgi:translation elongation factor P/translation initiation factor 5A